MTTTTRALRARSAPAWLAALAVGGALAAPAWAGPFAASEASERIAETQRLLEAWQIDEAAALAEELHQALPDVPPVQAVVGEVKFHQGDYEGALRLLERASEGAADPALLDLVRSTYEETRGSVSFSSEHFVVRTPAGKDELLAPIALDALEKAYTRVSAAFDYHPRHKIPVDVLHDARGLAKVSTLTVKEIETSGTIALCKFNRLMITSPKALARGYSWLDTLSHELIHLVVSEKSRNTVPIWLHEGLAKYSETLWRGPPGLALEAPSENLLAAAVKKNKLITFEQMHPSIAKLPSQEDTALAFAEVFTVVEWMHTQEVGGGKRKADDELAGYQVTNRLLQELARGADMDAALKRAVGKNLKAMQKTWRAYLQKRPFKLVAGAEPKKLRFVRNARGRSPTQEEQEEEGALLEAKSRSGKRYVRLGSLLHRRGRLKAATVEYEKAAREIGEVSPILNNRIAGLHLELGEQDRARAVLETTVKAYPTDPQTHILLGRLALREKRFADARDHYERSAWENPFNPEIHVALHQIGEASGDQALKDRAASALRLLSGHAQEQAQRVEGPAKGEPFGTLTVDSTPWGQLWIDGVDTGMTTPTQDLKLAPGSYRLRVVDPTSGQQAVSGVDVEAGKNAAVRLRLATVAPAQVEQWVGEETLARERKRPRPAAEASAADPDHDDPPGSGAPSPP